MLNKTWIPNFTRYAAATAALKRAGKLAADATSDALAMQKALVKLQQADELLSNDSLHDATRAFGQATQNALDSLAFEFAHDLRAAFEARGDTVEGRPPTLVVGELVLQIDIAARRADWYYGKEALTRPLPLSVANLIKAYDQQRKALFGREIDTQGFMLELYQAWDQLLAQYTRKPSGDRIGVIDVYSKVTLNRQNKRFWNSPSRSTFKDYPRPIFVRDLVLAHAAPTVTIDGTTHHLRLGGATKSQADSPQRSIWLPFGPLDGEYYADLTFSAE